MRIAEKEILKCLFNFFITKQTDIEINPNNVYNMYP